MTADAEAFRQKVIDAGIQGKLTEQLPEDGTAQELFEQIQEEKARLVKEGKIKKQQPLPPIKPEEIPFEIPRNWMWVRLGDIFDHNTGKALNTSDKEGSLLEYITTSNVYWDHFELNGLKSMYFRDDEIEKCTIKKGDLLICEGGDIGRSAIWPYEQEMRIQNHLHKLRSFKTEINVKYYFYMMWSYKNSGLINGRGIGLQGFSSKRIHSLIVPLPPLTEQQRIAERIEEILSVQQDLQNSLESYTSDVSAMKSKVIDAGIQGKLTEQLPEDGTAQELFEQIQEEKTRLVKEGKIKKQKPLPPIKPEEIPFEIPENWMWVRLGEIGNWSAGATPSRSNPDYYNGNIPWIKTGELNDDYIIDSDEYISDAALQECSVRLNPVGSVLIAMYGATIGKTGILDIEATTNQACCACIPFLIDNKYLFYFLIGNKQRFLDKSHGGAQPNISKDIIVNSSFPLPPLAEQQRIAERIEEILSVFFRSVNRRRDNYDFTSSKT